MDQFWDYNFWNNSVKNWAIALGIIIGSVIILRILKTVGISRIKVITEKTKTSIDDFFVMTLQRAVMPLLYLLAVYIGFKYLTFPERVNNIAGVAALFILTFFVLRMITSVIGFFFNKMVMRARKDEQSVKASKGILLIIQIFVWIIGLLFLVDNLGYDITTIVAGLGIGGIAIALAAQTILGDLFSYFVIFFDKPFEVDDFVVLDDKAGRIEHIGIKTTRIRSLGGEQLVCSNTDLTNARLHNYKRMLERRILFQFGVTYDTPAQKLKKIPQQVKAIISSVADTRFDRTHFLSFADSSLNFEVVYFVLSPDYNMYMDRQHEINIRLYELFEKEGISFAFPTRTIHLVQNEKEEELNGEERVHRANA